MVTLYFEVRVSTTEVPFWLEGCGDFKDEKGWVKVSAKGNKFRMTAEQLLNPLLPAIAGVKPGIKWKVDYRYKEKIEKVG